MKITFKRYKNRNMYIQDIDDVCAVVSYETLIGYLFTKTKIFATWGYSRYSTTTSKQITQLCHELGYKRVDISEDYNLDILKQKYQ